MKDDDIWRRNEVESPCNKICVIERTSRLCAGCLRSIDEIAGWSRMSAEERRDIMDVLHTRQRMLSQRKGGRAARLKAGNG